MESAQKQSSEPMRAVTDDNEEDEISLLDVFVVLARQKKVIVRTIAVFFVIGLVMAITATPEYTSSATVIREVESASPTSSALSALRSFGVNVGGVTTGLTADAYPDILKSREVRLAVVRDTFYFSDIGERMTFVDYTNRDSNSSFLSSILPTVKAYTLGLPRNIMSLFSSVPNRTSPGSASTGEFPTEEEEEAMLAVDGLVSTSADARSGLFTITVTTSNPILSAELTSSFTDQLVARVRSVFTEKSRENLDFIQERFDEAAESLKQAEEALARFVDQNVSVTSARLGTERQRLQRQVTFKSQLYSDLQTQLTQTEIELQRAAPVVTVIEQPVPPLTRSGPHRKTMVLFSLILGGMLGVGLAFVRSAINNQKTDEESRAKIEEIKAAIPEWPLRLAGKALGLLISAFSLGQKQLGKMRDVLKSRATTARKKINQNPT